MKSIKVEALNKEIAELKHKKHTATNIDDRIKYLKQYHRKALELVDLVDTDEKTRAGITAKDLIKRVKNMPTLPKFATGITKLDAYLSGGFQTGLFVNLAGESGAGKTTMLMNILANMSSSRKTVFFNFEMGDRLFASKLQKLNMNDTQLDNLIIDSENNGINELIMEIEVYAADGVKFFAIDSKMKIKADGALQEYQAISKMSSDLARLAARKDIVIFLINQMNEEDIKNKRLAFKGSGDQKYDSDIALFLVNENGKRNLICNKNRQNDKLFCFEISEADYKDQDAPVVYEMPDII